MATVWLQYGNSMATLWHRYGIYLGKTMERLENDGPVWAQRHDHSVLSDFTGFTVAARRLRKVTTAMVTPNTATNATANTQICSGT